MKILLNFLLAIPIISYGQSINPYEFVDPVNTGTNMSVAFAEINQLDQFSGALLGVFYDLNSDGDMECVGLDQVHDNFFIVTVWGDDELTEEKDGLSEGDNPIFAILTDDEQIVLFDNLDDFAGYSTNYVSFNYQVSTSASYCNDESACNFIDFNYSVNQSIPNCEGLIGCMEDSYLEYNSMATCSDSSCTTEVVLGCMSETALNYYSMANIDDGSCVFETSTQLVDSLEGQINNLDSIISDLNLQLTNALLNQEDGIGQVELNLAIDSAFAAGVSSVDITSNDDSIQNIAYLLGYEQGELDGIASVTPEDGIGQSDIDSITLDFNVLVSDLQLELNNQVSVISLYQDSIEALIVDNQDLTIQLENALLTEDAVCEPIFIDIVEGWNIIGYTLPVEQDVISTVSDIVNDILIIKNNNAQVYWPQFNFNGIGNFIPGQGYQIKTTNEILEYSWPILD